MRRTIPAILFVLVTLFAAPVQSRTLSPATRSACGSLCTER